MGGFAALFGGMNQPIQDRNRQLLDQYYQQKQAMIQNLMARRAGNNNPEDIANIDKTLGEIYKHQPGTPLANLLGGIAKRFVPHRDLQQIHSGVPGPVGDDHPTEAPELYNLLKKTGYYGDGSITGTSGSASANASGTTGSGQVQSVPPPQSDATDVASNPIAALLSGSGGGSVDNFGSASAPSGSATAVSDQSAPYQPIDFSNGAATGAPTFPASKALQAMASPQIKQPIVAPAVAPQMAAQPATSLAQTSTPLHVPPPPAPPASAASVASATPSTSVMPMSGSIAGYENPYGEYKDPEQIRREVYTPYGHNITAEMDKEIQPILQQRLSQNKSALEYNVALSRLKQFRESPDYGSMDPMTRLMYEQDIMGSKLPYSAQMFTPHMMANNTLGRDIKASNPNATDFNGVPINESTAYRTERVGNTLQYYPIAAQTVVERTPDGQATFNKQTGEKISDLNGTANPVRFLPGENGATVAVNPYAPATPGRVVPGAVSRSTASTSTTSPRAVQTIGPDGVPQTSYVPFTSIRTVGGSGTGGGASSAPTPVHSVAHNAGNAGNASGTGAAATDGQQLPRGTVSFTKPFTPMQSITEQQKLNQYDIAIDRMQDARNIMAKINASNPGLIRSMIQAGKLQVESDPHSGVVKGIVNRMLPMSDEEKSLAADYLTLMEDINLTRGAMQATGFRGPDAFEAMQAGRGNPFLQPDVTLNVMNNTLRALRGQRDPLAKRFKSDGANAGNAPAAPTAPTNSSAPAKNNTNLKSLSTDELLKKLVQ